MDENKAKSNAFMDFINDPSQIVKSTKFNMATAGVQFVALIFFAVVGASIGFRFENFRDILNLDYWISVVVLLMEQLYAMNIGYDLGKTMTVNSNQELATTQEQSAALIEGAYDEKTGEELVRPLKKDSAYIDIALQEIMDEEKIQLVKERMDEIIKLFESKLDYFKALTKGFYFRRLSIKVGTMKKKFHKRSTAIRYCEQQIADGNKMLENRSAILAVPDVNVKGFTRYNYADLMSNQESGSNVRVSKYYQKNEGQMKQKMFGKKALINILMAMIGPAILFGVNGGDQTLGMVVYSIFLLFVQLANGFKQGSSNAISAVLYNAVNRLKALQDVRARIVNIKARETEREKAHLLEVQKQKEEELRLQLQEQKDIETRVSTSILPPLKTN
jgi:hypothetical protein